MTYTTPGVLGDTPMRSYGRKLDLFARHAEPELAALLRWLPVQPGHRVLDSGCGTGLLTRWLGDLVGPDGLAVGLDLAAEHIASAATKGEESKGHLSFLQADLLL
ncbi:MAG TPA: methyltransferase domain-containing protein, partial [Longimicrobiales bacterium]